MKERPGAVSQSFFVPLHATCPLTVKKRLRPWKNVSRSLPRTSPATWWMTVSGRAWRAHIRRASASREGGSLFVSLSTLPPLLSKNNAFSPEEKVKVYHEYTMHFVKTNGCLVIEPSFVKSKKRHGPVSALLCRPPVWHVCRRGAGSVVEARLADPGERLAAESGIRCTIGFAADRLCLCTSCIHRAQTRQRST